MPFARTTKNEDKNQDEDENKDEGKNENENPPGPWPRGQGRARPPIINQSTIHKSTNRSFIISLLDLSSWATLVALIMEYTDAFSSGEKIEIDKTHAQR